MVVCASILFVQQISLSFIPNVQFSVLLIILYTKMLGFKKVKNVIWLSIFGLLYGFVYGWVYIPFAVFLLDTTFMPYLIMDIPFEVLMGISNMISILWLYEPLKKAFIQQLSILENKVLEV